MDEREEAVERWKRIWSAAAPEHTSIVLAEARKLNEETEALCGLVRATSHLVDLEVVPAPYVVLPASQERAAPFTATVDGADFE